MVILCTASAFLPSPIVVAIRVTSTETPFPTPFEVGPGPATERAVAPRLVPQTLPQTVVLAPTAPCLLGLAATATPGAGAPTVPSD